VNEFALLSPVCAASVAQPPVCTLAHWGDAGSPERALHKVSKCFKIFSWAVDKKMYVNSGRGLMIFAWFVLVVARRGRWFFSSRGVSSSCEEEESTSTGSFADRKSFHARSWRGHSGFSGSCWQTSVATLRPAVKLTCFKMYPMGDISVRAGGWILYT